MSILRQVKWLRTLTTLAMLALWLPVTNHCRLEQIPAFAFFVCCDHKDAAPHQDNDCETDGCDLVENALYKSENNQVKIVAPVFILVDVQVFLRSETASLPWSSPVRAETVPPELAKVWQFSFRAAAPPRAPSLAS